MCGCLSRPGEQRTALAGHHPTGPTAQAGNWGPKGLGLFYPEPTSLGFRSDRSLGNILGDDRDSGTLSFAGK